MRLKELLVIALPLVFMFVFALLAPSLAAQVPVNEGTNDFADSTKTAGRITPGQTVTGAIGEIGDKDWIAVDLAANEVIWNEYDLNFLGQVPLGMEVREGGDRGIPEAVSAPDSPQSIAFHKVAEEDARHISVEAVKPELVILSRAK